MRASLAAVMLSLALQACSSPTVLGGDPSIKVAATSALPEPGHADLAATRRYAMGANDQLTIDVFGIEELTKRDVRVDAGGRISLPLAGSLEVAGRTPSEVELLLRDRLRSRHVRDPQVSVNVKEATGQVVTVDGAVREPGQYPIGGGMTLMRAVAAAKGLGEFAKLEDVVIFRTVSGQRYAALYNLQAIREARYPDPDVFPNDIVVVGDSPGRRLFKDLLMVLPALSAPLVVALQN